MTLKLALPAALVQFFRGVPPPIEAIAPEPEWERELRKLSALTEIHRCKVDNLVFYDFTKKNADRFARVDSLSVITGPRATASTD